ncbi:MAG: urease accessory protein UreD [Bacilli bacterium]
MNARGLWQGEVRREGNRSVLARSLHQAPLKVAKPFAGPDGEAIVYLMDASPGLFGGDSQDIMCTVGCGAHAVLTNQSASKLHPSQEGGASRLTQRFYVAAEGALEYLPEPVIPFADAVHVSDTEVWLVDGAQAIIGDVITAGRVKSGEAFAFKRLANRFSVYWNGVLEVRDALDLQSSRWQAGPDGFADYTHAATLWVLSERVTKEYAAMLQELLAVCEDGSVYAGCSMLPCRGLVIRMLGRSGWRLQEELRRCWDAMRRELLGRPALSLRK